MISILEKAYENVKKTKEEMERNDMVFKIIGLYMDKEMHLESYKIALEQYEFITKMNPEMNKRRTFAIDAIVLALLLKDLPLAEQNYERFSQE